MQQISIWEADTFYAPQDVVIVGAGFTGLWTAFHIKQKYPAKKVTVMEAGSTPNGASVRNAGFACFGSVSEIFSDLDTLGEEKTLELLQWRFEGLQTIRQHFNDVQFDYQNCGGYELIDNEKYLDQVATINKLLYPISSATETFVVNNAQLENFGFGKISHIIENRFEGALHPGKLITALMQKLMAMDVQLLFGTELKQIDQRSKELRLQTTDKRIFKTQQLIYCTNAFSKNLLPDIPLIPARGQVLLTAALPKLPFEGVFHYHEGYYYFRNLGNRVLLGGARNTSIETEYTLDAFTTLPIQEALEKFLKTVVLPGQEPVIEKRWAGIMAMGTDKYPILRQLDDRRLCAVRLSGMGVALAPTLGKMLSEMI
ncbi:FAD-dependent oxidoreductase [Niabella terrae]